MAKFSGLIGFGVQTQVRPGIWEDVIVEKKYYGDVPRSSRQTRDGENANDDLTINNSVSVVADAFANENIFAIRYVKMGGGYWKVDDVRISAPRLLLRLGGVWNGPRAS